MMEIELGGGWIFNKFCKVNTVLDDCLIIINLFSLQKSRLFGVVFLGLYFSFHNDVTFIQVHFEYPKVFVNYSQYFFAV